MHAGPQTPAPPPTSLSPLRVALVTETFPPEVNGVAMTLGRLAEGLHCRGHAVEVVRPRQGPQDSPATASGWRETLVPGMPIPRYRDLRLGLASAAALARHWAAERPDVVHIATEGPLGWTALGAARRLGIPVSSGYHTHFDAYSRYYGLGWLRGAVTGYLRRFHNRTDATLVPTRALASALASDGFRNLAVLARGVDTALFRPTRRSAELRAGWGAGPETLVVLYVGRLAPEKNLGLVQRAFAAIRDRCADSKMVFVGDGPARKELERAHPEHVYAGFRRGEDLAAHYASADLFLFPSLTETFGNVTSEALASGLGVVAFRQAAAAELIHDGINGRLAPPNNDAAFINAAVSLAQTKLTLAWLRQQAAQSVARLDWDYIHDSFAGLLHELALGRSAGRTRAAVLAS